MNKLYFLIIPYNLKVIHCDDNYFFSYILYALYLKKYKKIVLNYTNVNDLTS